MPRVIDALLASQEPSVRWKVRVSVLGEEARSAQVLRVREQIRQSGRVRRLLDGQAERQRHPYSKWQGGHWVLMALADIGYPAADSGLLPVRDRVVATWLSPDYFRDHVITDAGPHRIRAVPVINGRHRRCGSQQGGALLSVVRLGLERDDSARLVERLLHWQWPDGGWNCDRDPGARSSSLYEMLLPMRALAAYSRAHDDDLAGAAARRAAEVLLERRIVYKRSTGQPIRSDWLKLHYPVYWRYDLLAGLKGLAEAGLIRDPRCQDALDMLEAKQLPGGGWAAEAQYFRGPGGTSMPRDHVAWGPVDGGTMNEWVTADVLCVLAAAGRLSL